MALRIIHVHRRADGKVRRRVSELVYLNGVPRILLGFVDLGGVRAPVYADGVDPQRIYGLGIKGFYRYEGQTFDPGLSRAAPPADFEKDAAR